MPSSFEALQSISVSVGDVSLHLDELQSSQVVTTPPCTVGVASPVHLGGTPGLAIEGTVCCTLVILPTVILERKYAWSVLDVCTGRVYFVRQSDLEEEKHSNTFHILRRWMREPLED